MSADRIHLHAPPRLPVDLLAGSDGMVAPDLLASTGPRSRRVRDRLSTLLGGAAVWPTPSCTDALEVAAVLAGVAPGDEVVVPTFTFPSTANAFLLRGARLRFADVLPDTLNVDPVEVARLVGPATRAVAVVHYAGVACAMDAITERAAAHEAVVVEDAAHALFGRLDGRPLGTIGELGALSFHRTKNLAVGEGGALVVNRPDLVERAEVVLAKGTDRASFERGDVDVYTWRDVGTAGHMTELAAALLDPQLEGWQAVQEVRRRAWDRYLVALADWAARHGVRLPVVPPGAEPAAHLFWMVLPDAGVRAGLQRHLADEGIESAYHYQPLHCSPMGLALGGRPGQCPVAETAAAGLLRLPLHGELRPADQERVIAAVLDFAP